MKAEMIGTVLVSITVIALAVAIYSGTGGRAWFGTHEKPDRLLGRRIRFISVDGLGQSPNFPSGKIEYFADPVYRVILDAPFEHDGKCEHFVDVRPHSKGWPVSGAVKRRTAITGTLESGQGFWADVAVVG